MLSTVWPLHSSPLICFFFFASLFRYFCLKSVGIGRETSSVALEFVYNAPQSKFVHARINETQSKITQETSEIVVKVKEEKVFSVCRLVLKR